MTTITSTVVEIKDPTLLNFHTQRETAYKETKKQIDGDFLTYQHQAEALDAFAKEVRHAGKQLQDANIKVPSKEELEIQRTSFLKRYEQFETTYEKIKGFAGNIKRTIEFLQPPVRSYAEKQSLKAGSLELYNQTKRSEEICLAYLRELNSSHESIVGLQNRMCTTLTTNTELSWSLQRFCAIVDNEGKPLSLYQRSCNYVMTPVVPKLNQAQTDNPSTNAASREEIKTNQSVVNGLNETSFLPIDTTGSKPPENNTDDKKKM